MKPPDVNQRGSSAGHDLVGRDKKTVTQTIYVSNNRKLTLIEALQQQLNAEIREDRRLSLNEFIDSLQYYQTNIAADGVVGLESKLKVSGREGQITEALRKKELFVKLLDRFSYYRSAQEFFAYFLAKIDNEFNSVVHSKLTGLSVRDGDGLVVKTIVSAVLDECAHGEIVLNQNNVLGMLYWLAERCYIRWHP